MAQSRSGSKTSSKTSGKTGSQSAAKGGATKARAGSAGGAGGRGERGTTDVTYNLVSVIYHALQGAETYGIYATDAEQDANPRLADFFRQIQDDSLKRAQHAKELLKSHL